MEVGRGWYGEWKLAGAHELAELTTEIDMLLMPSVSLILASFIHTLLMEILSSAKGLSFASNCITTLLSLCSTDAYLARSILHEQIDCNGGKQRSGG